MAIIGSANIERQVAKYFESGWEVWRNAAGQDSYGGDKPVPAKHIADLRGCLRPLSGNLRFTAVAKETEFATHKFYCAVADIVVGDQLRKGGTIYTVKFAQDVMSAGRLMQLDVEFVE